MAVVFRDIADEMNKRKFPVYVPESYEPCGLHPYFTENVVAPIFQPMDNDIGLSMLSPAEIADACFQKVPFTFKDERDRAAVMGIYDLYIQTVNRFIASNEKLKMFVERVRVARTAISTVDKQIELYKLNTGQIPERPKDIHDILGKIF